MISSNAWDSQQMLFPGLWVYKNVIKKDLNVIERIEDLLKNNSSGMSWQDATVGYMQKMPEYRDCQDFKLGEVKGTPVNQDQVTYGKIWKDLYEAQLPAVQDYCNRYNVKMDYWEVMNFIKYGPKQHFQEHADHGFSYSATVSLVAYPNGDYVGGGLKFPKLNLEIQPEAGDLYIFPSTYLFSHIALPVQSGTKYSLVTMLDYNDHAHCQEFYEMRQRKVNQENKAKSSY